MEDLRHLRLGDLVLDAPRPEDVSGLHAIYSDPRVWLHFPSLRHTELRDTEAMVAAWMGSWDADGLGPWIVRAAGGGGAILGNCGCALRGGGSFWNLGYRFSPDAQGRGLATRVAVRAVAAAQDLRPDVPVVAYLLEDNLASRRVAEKIGLELRHRGPDAGNPDPSAVRLVYADRPLDPEQLAAAMR
ncbi:hypothetical protein GCM10027418_08990 [Mariniluteicoccus endophyticus]